MAIIRGSIFSGVAIMLLCSMVAICYGEEVKLSQLPVTLSVSTTPPGKVNLQAGVGKITVKWALNQTSTSTSTSTSTDSDSDTTKYSKVAVKLCYRKESQVDRPWRRTEDELFKDKTCQHDIVTKPYSASGSGNTVEYVVKKDVPTGHYFVRVYAVDSAGAKVGYGQTHDADVSVTAITGRHASIDIAAAVFSAFSVVSLAFFFYLEKKKSKSAA